MLRIGILTPRSTLYPTMGFDLLNGFKSGLAHSGIEQDVTLFTDNIGFGIDEAEIYTKAEKMLLGDNADVVIACCDSRIAAMLQPLFTAAGKLLLVTNPGANLPESWQLQPTTIVHSLNFCFNAALTGAMAAAHGPAAMVAGYYDAGYNQVYCMVTEFLQKGGQIAFNHVTHLKADQFTLEPLQAFMASENGTPNLLCLFSADMAVQFYQAISALQQSQPSNLFVAPMMLEETLLQSLNKEQEVANIQGYTPWLSLLNNGHNQHFVSAYEAAYGKRPNLFAVLGWDNALLIQQLAHALKLHNNNTAAAVKAVAAGQPLPSPRGWIKLDPDSQHVYGPAWQVHASSRFDLTITDTNHLDIEATWREFTTTMKLSATEIHSAWRNTYLCI